MCPVPTKPRARLADLNAAPRSKVTPERTGWRDAAISARHRQWGVSCSATDLDFVLVEHCYGVPAALVEYKALGVVEYFNGPNYWAQAWLADRSEIPFVVAVYDPATWGVRVYPMNQLAQADFNPAEELTEREWVAWLYRTRGRISDLRLGGLADELPRQKSAHGRPTLTELDQDAG